MGLRRLTDAERGEVARLLPIAKKVSAGFQNLRQFGATPSDIYDAAVDGVMYAVTHHDPSRGEIHCFARCCARSSCIRLAYKLSRHGKRPLVGPLYDDHDAIPRREDRDADRLRDEDRIEDRVAGWVGEFARGTTLWATVVRDWLHGTRQTHTAARLGVSSQRVGHIRKAFVAHARRRFNVAAGAVA